jgi:hypothetical protein
MREGRSEVGDERWMREGRWEMRDGCEKCGRLHEGALRPTWFQPKMGGFLMLAHKGAKLFPTLGQPWKSSTSLVAF